MKEFGVSLLRESWNFHTLSDDLGRASERAGGQIKKKSGPLYCHWGAGEIPGKKKKVKKRWKRGDTWSRGCQGREHEKGLGGTGGFRVGGRIKAIRKKV